MMGRWSFACLPSVRCAHGSAHSNESYSPLNRTRFTESSRQVMIWSRKASLSAFGASAFCTASATVIGLIWPKCEYGDSRLVGSISGLFRCVPYPFSLCRTKYLRSRNASLLPAFQLDTGETERSIFQPSVISHSGSSDLRGRAFFQRTFALGFGTESKTSSDVSVAVDE